MLQNVSRFLALAAAFTGVAGAAGDGAGRALPVDASEAALEVFTGPQSIDLVTPTYPRHRQADSREGWVRLNFMVDAHGKPYEIAVTSSTGDPAFERAAVQAAERSTFQPASLNGEPIDAGHAITYQFALKGTTPGARPSFVRGYRKLSQAVNDGDQEQARAQLESLEVRNLYENAVFHLGQFIYHQRWGTPREQLYALSRAVGYEGDPVYLPEDLHEWALRALFSLELQTKRFAEALLTWERIARLGPQPQEAEAFQRAVDEILALRDDERVFAVSGEMGSASSWFYRLLKSRFQIDQVRGRLAEVKLRCRRQYVFLVHDPEVTYRIADGYAPCELEVVGDPGTTFRLVQS